MKTHISRIRNLYTSHFKERKFVFSFLVSFGFLIISLLISFYASIYANAAASNPVTDIILSNIRVYDVDWAFVDGVLVFWILVSIILLNEPKRLPFTLKAIATFVIIRSVFITLTHIAVFPTHDLIPTTGFMSYFISNDDLFFSAHTGLPFLLALIFWDEKYLRYFFIVSSIFFGAIVLLGHYHYSIDVAAAFFITYTIYHIAKKLFPRDLGLFKKGIEPVSRDE